MTADLHVTDSLGMFDAAHGLADQIDAAAATAAGVQGLPSADGVTAAVVMGMGGSGIGGDVTAALAGPSCAVPVVVSKGYECPAWVGPDSLVIAVSFSGNTEETLAAASTAAEAGARLVVVATGGKLAALAQRHSAPVVPLDATIPMPRAALGAVSVSPLVVLERLGLIEGVQEQVAAAAAQVRRRLAKLNGTDDDATRLARRIGRTMALVYGGGALGEVAAWRWKGQFNENAKAPAWCNRIPELTHNEVAGWGVNGDMTRQVLTMVLLRHDFEHPQVARRFDLVADVCGEVVADVLTVRAEGEGPLAQLMDLVVLGDLASLHLAVQTGVDPGPVAVLDDIKAALRSG